MRQQVYDLSWAPDGSCLTTASSDSTAKLWDVAGATAGPHADNRASAVFQHACFVYAAQFHPTATAPRVVATGAYDHIVRLWSCDTGLVLTEVAVHDACVNTLCFDALGKRLYSGDGGGVLKELSCDVGHSKSRSHPDKSRLRVNVKLLRSGTDMQGEPIAHVKMHPQGRKLIVVTKRSRLCAVDVKLFAVSHSYAGMRCTSHPLKVEVSPDGRYLLAGSEDGRVNLWDFHTCTMHHMPAFQVCYPPALLPRPVSQLRLHSCDFSRPRRPKFVRGSAEAAERSMYPSITIRHLPHRAHGGRALLLSAARSFRLALCSACDQPRSGWTVGRESGSSGVSTHVAL
jgi:WD40 repeat protein